MALGRGRLLSQIVGLASGEQKLMTPGQFITSPINQGKSDLDAGQFDSSVATEESQVCKDHVVSKEPASQKVIGIPQEDIDWQVYKFTRKVKETLKYVNEDNLSEVSSKIQTLCQDYPLSSRFRGANCSEVKHILEVLIQKSVTDQDFVVYAPKLIKMIHATTEVEFLQYFPTLIQERRKEVINVCASQVQMLPDSAKNFCQLLGKLFILPRQVNTKFYGVICAIVEEFVERWTVIDESESQSNYSGHNLSIAQVKAAAAHTLIKEIAGGMYECDSEVRDKMENFVWSLRETILNCHIPRSLKEVYLDALVDIQCGSSQNLKSSSKVEVNDVSDEDDVEIEEEEEEEEEEEVFEKQDEKDVSKTPENKAKDAFMVVKYFLTKNELDDLLPDFIDNDLTDEKLAETSMNDKNWMLLFQNAGISKLLSRNMVKVIESKDWEVWAQEASSPPLSSPNSRSSRNSSLSNRMAISFPPVSPTLTNKTTTAAITTLTSPNYNQVQQEKTDDNSCDVPPPQDVNKMVDVNCHDYSFNNQFEDNVQYSKDNNSGSDVEIEDDDDDDDDDDDSEENPTSTNSPIFNNTATPKRYPGAGRGRGMVKFYDNKMVRGGARSHVPVAKIPPTERNFEESRGKDDKLNHAYDNRKQHYDNGFTKSTNGFNWPKKVIKNKNKPQNTSPFQARPQPGRFQPVYHSKTETVREPQAEQNKMAFGRVKPRMCFTCSSIEHTTEECTVINPFF